MSSQSEKNPAERPANDDEQRLVIGAEQQVGAGEDLEEDEGERKSCRRRRAGSRAAERGTGRNQERSRPGPIPIAKCRAPRKPRIAAAKSNV